MSRGLYSKYNVKIITQVTAVSWSHGTLNSDYVETQMWVVVVPNI